MAIDYKKYEANCKKIRQENKNLLDEFTTWLRKSNLKKKTIDSHVENVDFYINEFLLYDDAVEAENGAHGVSMFLGYWFIKKAMWASPSQIKANAASLKKFYTFMYEKGKIEKDDLDDLKETIKEGMPEWTGTMERYDDPTIEDMEDVWRI